MSKYITSFQNYSSYSSGYNNLDKPNVSLCVEEKKVYYNPVPEKDKYLRFYALEDGTFQFTNNINYSLDGGRTWEQLTANTDSPVIKTGSYILWKATLTPNSTDGIGTFSSSGQYNAMGNPLSLRLGDNFKGVTTMPAGNYCFYKLFRNSTGLISASDLSLVSTTLRNYCYNYMFAGCSNLVSVCNLPAKSLTVGCYYAMFNGCSSLVTAPLISATYCFGYNSAAASSLAAMFLNCTSLTSIAHIPSSPASGSQNSYTHINMFKGCSSLVSIPSVTINLSKGNNCQGMFYGCSSLTDASGITFSGTAAYMSLKEMFRGCSSLTVPPSTLPSSFGDHSNCDGMFRECTSLVNAPELPAETLTNYCYQNMFYGCTSLQNIKCLATTKTATDCLKNWVTNVPTGGTFVKHPDTTWTSGVSGVPSGWTIEDAII